MLHLLIVMEYIVTKKKTLKKLVNGTIVSDNSTTPSVFYLVQLVPVIW